MGDKERDHIITLAEKGLEAREIGEMFGRSSSIVRQIVRVYNMAKDGNVAGAWKSAIGTNNTALFGWACSRNGIDPHQAMERRTQGSDEVTNRDATVAKKEIPDTEAIVDAILAQTGKMELWIEDLTKKLDQLAVIIQSCTAGLKETMNVNTDLLNRELTKHTETLNGIKSNTRFKGGNQIR